MSILFNVNRSKSIMKEDGNLGKRTEKKYMSQSMYSFH